MVDHLVFLLVALTLLQFLPHGILEHHTALTISGHVRHKHRSKPMKWIHPASTVCGIIAVHVQDEEKEQRELRGKNHNRECPWDGEIRKFRADLHVLLIPPCNFVICEMV